MRKIFLFGFVLLTIFLYGCSSSNQLETKTTVVSAKPVVGLNLGNMAPDFDITTIDGEQVSLSSFSEENKPVLVYFMATWCPFCARDFSTLSNVYESYEDVPILASSLDLKEDASLLSSYKSRYPKLEKVMFASGKEQVLRDYNVIHTTTKYAIGRDGTVLYAGSGPLDEKQWRVLLDALRNS